MTKSIIVALDEYDQIKFDKVLDQLDPNLCMVNLFHRFIQVEYTDMSFQCTIDLKKYRCLKTTACCFHMW